MNQDILETIFLFVGCCWMFFRWTKTKSRKTLFAILIILCLLPWRWPLFLPIEFSFGLIAICAAIFLLLENYGKSKKKESLAYFYILLFVIFGIIFYVEALFRYKQIA